MANLQTLTDISNAREELYTQLKAGEVGEVRAREMERILRGQTALKGELPLKALRLISGNKKVEPFAGDLVQSITGFVTGQKALSE